MNASASGLKSVQKAYQRVAQSAGPKPSQKESPLGKAFSALISAPMTREEALKILDIEKLGVNDEHATQIMEKFDKMMTNNDPEQGGSYYLQCKVFYAKKFLMQDFREEFDSSEWNPKAEDQNKAKNSEDAAEKD